MLLQVMFIIRRCRNIDMDLIRSTKQEIKKLMRLPYFMTGVLGLLLLHFLGIAYTDEAMKDVTILEMLVSGNAVSLASENNFLMPLALVRGFDKWFMVFVPSFSIIGYVLTLSDERKLGEHRFLLMRENLKTYCLSKLISLMIVSGIIVLVSYSSYIIILNIVLRPYFKESAFDSDIIAASMGAGSSFELILRFVIGAFFFGMFIVLPGFIAGIFFNDRYMLVCFPVLAEYLVSQAFSYVLQKNPEASGKLNGFRITNLIGAGVYEKWLFTLLFSCLLMALAFLLFVFVCEKRKRSGKYV